jgi:hypothetical protein
MSTASIAVDAAVDCCEPDHEDCFLGYRHVEDALDWESH